MRVLIWMVAGTLAGCAGTGEVFVADPAERGGELVSEVEDEPGGVDETTQGTTTETEPDHPPEGEVGYEDPCSELAGDCLELGVSEETCGQAYDECVEAQHEGCDEDCPTGDESGHTGWTE